MAKHRRYSRKRSQRRNRRISRKMKGGIGQDNVQYLTEREFTPEQIEYLITQHPAMDIAFIELSLAGNNPPFFPVAQTPDQIITALQSIDVDIDKADESLNTTREAISQYSDNSLNMSASTIPEDEDNYMDVDDEQGDLFGDDDMDIDPDNSGYTERGSMGGKGKKRRTNKRKTNKRKTKKTRKRRHYGGRGFTTQEETSPLAYIDSREVSEANMTRP